MPKRARWDKQVQRHDQHVEHENQDDFASWFEQAADSDPGLRLAAADAACRSELLSALIGCRHDLRLTQQQVADAMQTTQSAVSELEAGATDPRLSTLQRYARAVEAELRIHLEASVLGRFQWSAGTLPSTTATITAAPRDDRLVGADLTMAVALSSQPESTPTPEALSA